MIDLHLTPRVILIVTSLLFAVDVIFIALHAFVVLTHFSENIQFRVDVEGGYAEYFQYLKWVFLAAMFGYFAFSRRFAGYGVWVVFFAYLLFDDMREIHETVGTIIASQLSFSPPFGLRLQDMGELSVSAIVGALFVTIGAVAYGRGDNRFRTVCWNLLSLVGVLAFFGVGCDMAHIIMADIGWKINVIIGAIEDSGEMVAASLICGYTIWTLYFPDNSDFRRFLRFPCFPCYTDRKSGKPRSLGCL
jgi:hypothetical protein